MLVQEVLGVFYLKVNRYAQIYSLGDLFITNHQPNRLVHHQVQHGSTSLDEVLNANQSIYQIWL